MQAHQLHLDALFPVPRFESPASTLPHRTDLPCPDGIRSAASHIQSGSQSPNPPPPPLLFLRLPHPT